MELNINLTVQDGYADAEFDPAITDEQLAMMEDSIQELVEAAREALSE